MQQLKNTSLKYLNVETAIAEAKGRDSMLSQYDDLLMAMTQQFQAWRKNCTALFSDDTDGATAFTTMTGHLIEALSSNTNIMGEPSELIFLPLLVGFNFENYYPYPPCFFFLFRLSD